MIPKVYLATYTFDVIVVAEDDEDAERVADRNADEEFGNLMSSFAREDCRPITDIDQIPKEWRDSLAYRDRRHDDWPILEGVKRPDDLTVSQWLEMIQDAERARRLAGPLPGQMELPIGEPNS